MGVALPVVIAVIALAGAATVASGVWWLPPLASNWASLDTMMKVTTLVTGIAFVVVHLFLAYFIYRYRSRQGHRAEYIDENPRLERWLVILTSVGIAAMLVPGLFSYAEVIAQPEQEPLVVEVLGEQWRWNYRFPGEDGLFGRTEVSLMSSDNVFGIDYDDPAAADDVILVGEALYLPLDQPVIMKFRSKDVLHNYWVPEFRVKIDAVPGIETQTWFVPTVKGTYQAACAEYCGIAHYVMLGDLHVVEPAEFSQWLGALPTVGESLE